MSNIILQSSFTVRFPTITDILYTDVDISHDYYDYRYATNAPIESQAIRFKAIWDTGATASVITDTVISQLGLNPIDKVPVSNTQGIYETEVYLANIYLPHHSRDNVVFRGLPVTRGVLCDPFSVLIGMDIITYGDFAITHPDGRTQMSFCIPPTRNLDFAEEVNRQERHG